MGLREQNVRSEYRTLAENVCLEFYLPLLREACLYQRAVGFFSSSALAGLAPGLCGLVQNGGHIQLIASPRLTEEDVAAIEAGYEARAVIEQSLSRALLPPESFLEEDRLNLLAGLIAGQVLDIRIAVTRDGRGIYHEKMGLITDAAGDQVAFSGSMNETMTGLAENYEAIDVFCSWRAGDSERVAAKAAAFAALWENRAQNLWVTDFPAVREKFLHQYQKRPPNLSLDDALWQRLKQEETPPGEVRLALPANVLLYDYQREAVASWEAHDFCGIFAMATGTGKTYTGLAAAARLMALREKLFVIIVCPFQHLVEQWAADVRRFGVAPLIGYSGPKYRDFKQQLAQRVFDFSHGFLHYLVFLCTNATFRGAAVQQTLARLGGRDTLLMVDEAHNFGAPSLLATLRVPYAYRLALSATFARHGDEEGTEALCAFFGPVCIDYPLRRAIAEDKLTPYDYHPVVVVLTEDERRCYDEISCKMLSCLKLDQHGKMRLTEQGKRLAIKRARLVAAATGKIAALQEQIEPYREQGNLLVYCGAANLFAPEDERESPVVTRQIDAISRLLNGELGMRTAQFTARENQAERVRILRDFAEGEIQALVAIKCLDEGVNIPQIRAAFLLASTTNPKEYIQRRGRVLRRAPGKTCAVIYDFITLPQDLAEVAGGSVIEPGETSLVKKELARMQEFMQLSSNPAEGVMLYEAIEDAYGICAEEVEEAWEEEV